MCDAWSEVWTIYQLSIYVSYDVHFFLVGYAAFFFFPSSFAAARLYFDDVEGASNVYPADPATLPTPFCLNWFLNISESLEFPPMPVV